MQAAKTTSPPTILSTKLLGWSLKTWFIVAVIGQLIFAAYVGGFYGGSALFGDLERWNDGVSYGYEEGATMSNWAVAIHLFFAFLITLGGPLQLTPWVRQNFPRFHRWNGRLYVFLTAIAALSGLYMLWAHEDAGAGVNRTAMSLEALLILVAGGLVWRFAIQRKMQQHEQWAVRLFLTASGVWFFRIILMGWIIVNGGPVGFDPETFTGPFISFVEYGHYLLPLAIYELYMLAKRSNRSTGNYVMAGVLFICAIVTAIGVAGATIGMWLPAFG